MFVNPGFRGLRLYPYPAHVKQMIGEVEKKVARHSPGRKVVIASGVEIEPNIDRKPKDGMEVVKNQSRSPSPSPRRAGRLGKNAAVAFSQAIDTDDDSPDQGKRDIF